MSETELDSPMYSEEPAVDPIDVKLDVVDDQILVAVDTGDVSIVLSAPREVSRSRLDGAVREAALELDHSLKLDQEVGLDDVPEGGRSQ